jgi:Arylsulfotransferase (ASST)
MSRTAVFRWPLAFVLGASSAACSTSNETTVDAGSSKRDASRDAGALDVKAGDSQPADGPPYLVRLGVTAKGMGSSALTLVPSFAPDVYDYDVRCATGTNALTVTMEASPGAESALEKPTKSAEAPKQTLSVSVLENQAIVARATRNGLVTEYWVRCLPNDFPPMQMTMHPEAGPPSAGYYLVGNGSLGPGASTGYAIVLDMHGVPVWYHGLAHGAVFNVDDVPSGEISFVGVPDTDAYELFTLDPFGSVPVTAGGLPPDEHELQVLPGGHFVVFTGGIEKYDLTGVTIPLPDGGVETLGSNEYIVACNIDEVDASGSVVWSWVATDYFDPGKDQSYLLPVLIGPGGAKVYDFFHCNSIDVDPQGNLLVSSRNMDSIFYVERPSGNVLWKMGGQSYTKNGASYIPVADPFRRQHDARFQPGWKTSCSGASGSISLFDDETDEKGPARAVVYDVHVGPFGGDGGTGADCGTTGADAGESRATVAWQYQGTASVEVTGSFRIGADGSRVIGWGTNGGLVFSDVDVEGHDRLDFYFPDGNWSYRAIKVPTSTWSLSLLRNTAGLP